VVLGLPSLNTRLDSYFVEKVAMSTKSGSSHTFVCERVFGLHGRLIKYWKRRH
jgi:hypothetical protein